MTTKVFLLFIFLQFGLCQIGMASNNPSAKEQIPASETGESTNPGRTPMYSPSYVKFVFQSVLSHLSWITAYYGTLVFFPETGNRHIVASYLTFAFIRMCPVPLLLSLYANFSQQSVMGLFMSPQYTVMVNLFYLFGLRDIFTLYSQPQWANLICELFYQRIQGMNVQWVLEFFIRGHKELACLI